MTNMIWPKSGCSKFWFILSMMGRQLFTCLYDWLTCCLLAFHSIEPIYSDLGSVVTAVKVFVLLHFFVNLFTKPVQLNMLPLLCRSLRTSTYCVSCVPGTSTWTRRGRSFASRWPGGSSTRWTTCWRPGPHHRSSRTTTLGAGITMIEVGLDRGNQCV